MLFLDGSCWLNLVPLIQRVRNCQHVYLFLFVLSDETEGFGATVGSDEIDARGSFQAPEVRKDLYSSIMEILFLRR